MACLFVFSCQLKVPQYNPKKLSGTFWLNPWHSRRSKLNSPIKLKKIARAIQRSLLVGSAATLVISPNLYAEEETEEEVSPVFNAVWTYIIFFFHPFLTTKPHLSPFAYIQRTCQKRRREEEAHLPGEEESSPFRLLFDAHKKFSLLMVKPEGRKEGRKVGFGQKGSLFDVK